MKRARHRKTKSASGIEGIQQIQKQKTVPRLSADSHSYDDQSNRDDMFMLEMGQHSLGRVTGIPMKKLMAEEMSKDVEYKRRPPGVIAKLMGFEGLPSPRRVQRQQKNFLENHKHNNVSINDQRNGQLYNGSLNWKSSVDRQEFKDVYEDLEASHSSQWSANSILTNPEMESIQQKFMDAKRLFTDEKLQGSEEFDDTLEMLDSSKDLLLKLFGQSDSLFVNHLHDLQVDIASNITVLKPSNPDKFESKAKEWRSGRGTSNKPHFTSDMKREDGLQLERQSCCRDHLSRSSSKVQVEDAIDEKSLPTRIVVLKPNLVKMQNTTGTSSSPDDSQGYLPSFKKIKEYPSVGCAETGSWRMKESSRNTGLSKTKPKEAREIAREVTMRMRDGYDETMGANSTAYRGYVGDESSYDANESDYDSESEILRLSSRRSSGDSNNCMYPSYHFGESPVHMEAKKRLSKRWEMNQKYQNLEMSRRGSTLGEMLACPDKETSSPRLNANMVPTQASKGLGFNNGTATSDFPLGISSRDGWKDLCINSTRSRSLPPPTGGRRKSHRRSPNLDKWTEEKKLMHSDSVHCGKSKVVKGNLSPVGNYSAKDSKSRSKAVHPCQHIFANGINSLPEANIEIEMEPSEQQSMFATAEKAACSEFHVDVMMISEPGSTTMSSKSFDMLLEQSPSTIASDKLVNHKQEDCDFQELLEESPTQGSCNLQCLGVEPESSTSSKEADHRSPISVLEVHCSEDMSSSESFERVGADLHGLRMQLKLLKMESGAYSEASMLHLVEEEEAQPSANVSEGNHVLAADSWTTTYALDLLTDSGLEESQFNIFRTPWHSSDGPLDPKLFDKLEKKYNDGVRWERRLLFDRTNSILAQILQDHANLCPWVMPKVAGSHLQWQSVQDAINKSIKQGHADGEITTGLLDREMLWSDSKREIDVLGNEIERLLMDDMINEVISM